MRRMGIFVDLPPTDSVDAGERVQPCIGPWDDMRLSAALVPRDGCAAEA
jgi:hypothetical protein